MSVFGDYFNKDEGIPVKDNPIKGKILNLSEEGWGFITSIELPFEKIFFHWTSLEQDTLRFPKLEEGMKIEFFAIEQENEKGYKAIKVRVINESSEE